MREREYNENEWVCHLCYKFGREYGQIAPGLYLFENDETGQLVLMGGQGHRDDEEVIFKNHPYTDPFFEVSDEELDKLSDDDPRWGVSDRFIRDAELGVQYILGGPEWGYNFVTACKEMGWRQHKHGFLKLWLFHKAGQLLEESEDASRH